MFGRLLELTGGTFRLDVHDILANDTHGIVLVTTHAERDGRTLASRRVDIWHLADGKAHGVLDLRRGPGSTRRVLPLSGPR
jgi:uncharacterized protein